MEVISWNQIADFSSLFENGTALTVGSFDGPHRGHDVLFQEVRKAASERALVPGVITFRKSAAAFHANGKYSGDITTLEQKLDVFAERDMSFAIVIDFSGNFITIKGEEFLSTLISVCRMKFIAEGMDFRCGWRGLFGKDEIEAFVREHGVESVFRDLVVDGGKRISSSSIRECIASGRFSLAASLLGRPYVLDCSPILWQNCNDGFSAGIEQCAQMLPPDGEYDVVVKSFDTAVNAKFFVERQNLRLVFPHEQINKIESIEFVD